MKRGKEKEQTERRKRNITLGERITKQGKILSKTGIAGELKAT